MNKIHNFTQVILNRAFRFNKFLYYYLTNYYSSNPRLIDIELTNRCNLACKMCWFHGENGIGDRYKNSELRTEEVLTFFDQFTSYKPKIYLGGSEPFMRKDFLLILEYLKSRNFRVSFATNGTLLDSERIRRLVKIGVDEIKFSVDGPEEVHDWIRGKGVFNQVTRAVIDTAIYRKRLAKNKPIISINTVFNSKLNGQFKDIIKAIREAVNDSADFYRLHHLWYVSKKELCTHQSAVYKALGCKAMEAKAHLITLFNEFEPIELANEIDNIRSCNGVSFFPNLKYDDIINYYSEGTVVKKRCSASLLGAVIKPNGDVKFCPDAWIDDYVIGNIRQEYFLDIWNNRQARNFRRIIMRQKQFAGCKRCSWMYSFNQF
jgi:radical SAM protein with 4Fe4S-binding SPASM domain